VSTRIDIRSESGFTLVEMLTAMTVFGILIAAYSGLLGSSIRHSTQIEEQTNLQVEARAAITQMGQDFRQAYDGDSNTTTSPIESVSGTQFTFLTPDRAQPFHLRRVSYRLNAGSLERAFATSTDTDGYPWSIPTLSSYKPMVGSIVNTSPFVYKTATGTTTTTASQVKTIEVTITVATKASPGRQYTYTNSFTVRGES
jgi:prepilin-type N-terminal cleavage/methylation domain-containing protein